MTSRSKDALRRNVLALIEKRTGPLRPHESGVTRLVAMGIANGTAQRALDAETSVRLETVDQLAEALEINPWDLLIPDGAAGGPMLLDELKAREVQLITLFRKLPSDIEQRQAVAELNARLDASDRPVHRRPERQTDTRERHQGGMSGFGGLDEIPEPKKSRK